MDLDKIAESVSSGFGSVLGIASSTVGGLVNNALSQQNAEAQRDWQEKMWHMQNKYNSPAAMAGRMRAAGLNPYTMTGAQPAGSAGQGAMAQTMPLESPLSALRTMAEIRNINASTNVEESTVEKILRESELIRIGVERGLIDNEQAKKLIDEMWSAYEAAGYSGPTGFEIKKGESEINENDSETAQNLQNIENLKQAIKESEQRIAESKSAQAYNEALTKTEDSTRPLKKALMSSQTEKEKATAAEAYASARCKNILSTLDEQYGPREREAALGSAESAAKYADAINAAAVALSKSAKELNDANAYTGKARIEIERAAQELKEKYYDIDKNRFALEAVTQGSDSVAKIIDALIPG